MKIYSGRPDNIDKRLKKEQRVYELLDNLEIEYERVDHHEANSIEECEDIEKVIGPICKNLFLCTASKKEFYMLMLPGEKKFRTKDVSAQIPSSRLSFASPEYMEKYLDITPGSVSVMGLMNDVDNHVNLLVDEDIINEEFVVVHPCINTSSLKIRTKDIFGKYLKAVNHDMKIIHI